MIMLIKSCNINIIIINNTIKTLLSPLKKLMANKQYTKLVKLLTSSFSFNQ